MKNTPARIYTMPLRGEGDGGKYPQKKKNIKHEKYFFLNIGNSDDTAKTIYY